MRSKSQPKRLRRLANVWVDHDACYLTLCTENRKPVLANLTIHKRMSKFSASSLSRYGIWIDSYVLMPDHLHCLVTLGTNSVTLGVWVKALKAVLSGREFKWQRGFFDHVLRSNESRSEKWEYIRMNPVRAGLVSDPEEWAYWGCFNRKDGRSKDAG